ncbi:MAG: replication-associated recombination protein A [Candidatus Cloacimonetes bacterium]|nr:replication-associated recombination protein A [Candidatus Cloacimonadota bacterium]
MSEQLEIFGTRIKPTNVPLAERVRPQEIEGIKGQKQLLAAGSLLRTMLEQDNYASFIMWGPPGTGKTTIARLIAQRTASRFLSFSAVLASIKEVKDVMKEAEYNLQTRNQNTILFVDEIHRFNKSQQDAFLPYIESGAIILLGATTENPSFEVIPALLSRCHVFVLEKLNDADILQILKQAQTKLDKPVKFGLNALTWLAEQSGGDARSALNYLEMIVNSTTAETELGVEQISEILKRKTMFYDKNKEEHYNLISALHKSLRGSDPQAGLYWLARMLEAGEEPLYLARRLVRFASEDVGLADPQALVQAIAVKEAVHFLGMPEANTALAQLVVYLGTAPKSNAIYEAYNKAREEAHKTSHLGVPMHIRNAPTSLMKELDYGKDYHYDHQYENKYFYQKYFPAAMKESCYYQPSSFGFEKEIRKRLDWWQKLKEKQLQEQKDEKNND